MSQRRRKLPDLDPVQALTEPARQFTVKVACTDRWQHSAVVLYHLRDMRGDPDLTARAMWPDGPMRKPPLTIGGPALRKQRG